VSARFLLHQGPARNRLLVKGGSSFNALVRAMKQDLIDNGTAAKDPALLYEIDKVTYSEGRLITQPGMHCLILQQHVAC
jgi:hypothetical protein